LSFHLDIFITMDRRIIYSSLFLSFILLVCCSGKTKRPDSSEPVAEEIREETKVSELIRKVNDRWQSTHPDHENAFWHRAAYHTGNMAAYEVTGEEAYKDYSTAWAEKNEWKGANPITNPNGNTVTEKQTSMYCSETGKLVFKYISIYIISNRKKEK